MQTNIRIALLLFTLAIASCSRSQDEESAPARTIQVAIGSGPRIDIAPESRTALGDDGVSVKWNPTDRIALWAENSAGTMQLSAHRFSLWHYNEAYNAAQFSATIPEMPTDTYIYYATSPMPESVSGTTASYTIPSTQDGAFNGNYDIMVATPVTGSALQEGDNSQSVNLNFSHKVHILKIRIPSNNLGEEISAIRLDFPVAVTGKFAVDATDPTAAPVITNGSNSLLLEFATPKKAGDVVYAMIAPVTLTGEQSFTITAIGTNYESETNTIAGKDFSAGHTTPIAYNIPSAKGITLRIYLANTGENTLGEKINSIILNAPAGSTFDNGSNVRSIAVTSAGYYTIAIEKFKDQLSGKTITANFDSDNALLSQTFTVPKLKIGETNDIATLSVPYLLEENFDSVQTYSNNENTTGINDPAAIWIPGLSGWTAARTGGSAGQSVRIVGHREGAAWVPADYEGRMDSAPMSGIKSGKSVTVKISFNYSGGTNKGAPKFRYGTSTAAGLINGANNSVEQEAGNISANTSGSYANVNQAITPFTASSATPETRIAWVAYGNDGVSFTMSYYYYYIYIDNIKVSISK